MNISTCGAVPGVWYQHEKWGKMLCCGTSNPQIWLNSFAIRNQAGRTRLKFIRGESLTKSQVQSWEPEPDMLTLSRKEREQIIINDDIVITVQQIRSGQVKIGIKAPPDTPVHRQEVYEKIQKEHEAGKADTFDV